MLSFQATPAASSAIRTEQVLAAIPQPLLVLLPDRRLQYANASSEDMFDRGLAGRVSGRLTGIGQLTACKIDDLLRQAVGGQRVRVGLWFLPELQTGWLDVLQPEYSLTRGTDWSAQSLLLVVHLDAPDLAHQARIDAITQQCRLTSTERYVLMLLADGQPVEGVAHQLGLRVSTLRSHVRNLLGKTQAASLMQLMRWTGSAANVMQ